MGGITEEVGGVTIGRNYHISPSSGQEDTFCHVPPVSPGTIQLLQRSARMIQPALHLRINPMCPSILQIQLSSLYFPPDGLSTLAFSPCQTTKQCPPPPVTPLFLPSAKAPAAAHSASTAIVLNHSLDSAIPVPMLGRSYFPVGANISPHSR